MFKDDSKLDVNNISEMENRKWRTSFIASTGCNVLVVVYECGYASLRVSIYVNEIPIQIKVDDYICTKCPLNKITALIESLQINHISPENEKSFDEIYKEKKKNKSKSMAEPAVTTPESSKDGSYTRDVIVIQGLFDDEEETYEKDT